MAIQTSEIKFYRASAANDTTSNGGRMSATEIVDAVKNNMWPDVPQSERAAGSTKYRKCFIKIANDDDLTMISPRILVETQTTGDDRILLFPGTQTNTQNDLTGSERLYGAGTLDANISAGVTSCVVNCEAAADAIFQNGDMIRISNKTSVSDNTGYEDFIRLAASGAVSWNGNKATLTFLAGSTPQNAYTTAAGSKAASVIEATDIVGGYDSWVKTSQNGTYNNGTYPPLLDSIGSVEQNWTLTFTSATAFNCVGDVVGSVTGGTTGANYVPNNSDFSKPYFTLRSAGFGGTWIAGDTIAFRTHPAAVPIWEKRIIPAGANSISGNKVIIAISGESA